LTPSTFARRLADRRRTLASAAIIAVALGLLGMLYAAIAPRGQAATSADPNVTEGRKLFQTLSCASCHGLNGEGGRRAPSLIGVGAAAVDFQMGTGRMPLQAHGPEAPRKRPAATEDEIHKVAAYVASLGGGPAIPVFSNSDWQKADTAFGCSGPTARSATTSPAPGASSPTAATRRPCRTRPRARSTRR
jgi:ubiquinol-cytochrome c reductase cytochrome c subunit